MWLNELTFESVVKVVSIIVALEERLQVHTALLKKGFDSDIFVGSSLASMYAKCGVVEDARKLFDDMPEWNVVLWSNMIARYALNVNDEEALNMCWQALMMGMRLKAFTFSMVLLICANITAYNQGKQVHIFTIKYEFDSYNFVGIYLVGMSAKCGFVSSFVHSFWESCQNSH